MRKQIAEGQEKRDEKYLRSIFDKLMPREGKISKELFRDALSALNAMNSSEAVDEIFHEFDLDGDGQIDFEEFKAAVFRT